MGNLGNGLAAHRPVVVGPVDRAVVGFPSGGQGGGGGGRVGGRGFEIVIAGEIARLFAARRGVPGPVRIVNQARLLHVFPAGFAGLVEWISRARELDPAGLVEDLLSDLALIHGRGQPGVVARPVGNHDDHVLRRLGDVVQQQQAERQCEK
jgi:hypothetical protein